MKLFNCLGLLVSGEPNAMAWAYDPRFVSPGRLPGSAATRHVTPWSLERNSRLVALLMARPFGSTGLTANLTPPSRGHWPAPMVGLSPGWSRKSDRVVPFTWKKLLSLPPQHGHL